MGVGHVGGIFGFYGVLEYPFCSVGRISELPFDRFRWGGMCTARVALGFVDGNFFSSGLDALSDGDVRLCRFLG